jgi:large subunit ribosomal protein L25
MAQGLSIEAEPREEFGKNAARRLRRAGMVPGIVYGDQGPAIPVTLEPRKIQSIFQSESGHNAIFTLEIKGKAPARVMLRDWMVDPVHGGLLHVDLVRVARDTKLKLKVPIHLMGEAQGVKVQGGIFEFILREVEVECLPDDIPEHITVDVTDLTIGKNLRVSDLQLGEKVKVLTDGARVVAHVVVAKEEVVATAPEVVEGATPAEPEVIRKGKGETEEAGEAEKDEGKEVKEKKEGGREPKKPSKKD